MEPQAECMLVIIGATPEGKKELVGFRATAVPDEPRPPIVELSIGHQRQKGLGFGLDRLRQQAPSPRAQDCRQRIIDLLGLPETDDGAILTHGVSLSSRGSGRLVTRLDTPPSSDRRHPASRKDRRRLRTIKAHRDPLQPQGFQGA